MNTVVETTEYRKCASKHLLSVERDAIIAYLAEHPKSGSLIQGTGGIRKLRWSVSGKGKSGGVRVIYYFHSELMPLYLLTMFGKSDMANITDKEKILLRGFVKELIKANGL